MATRTRLRLRTRLDDPGQLDLYQTAKPKSLWLIDGSAAFYRAFYAPFQSLSVECPECGADKKEDDCPHCSGTGREPTKGTYLFITQMLRLIKLRQPDYLCIAFDGNRADLYRRRISPAYKANRDTGAAPDPLIEPQFNRVKQLLKALGIAAVQCSGYEADDALATLAIQHAGETLEANIVARDKDFAVLCKNPNIFCYDPLRDNWTVLATAGSKYGIRTDQLLDYFTLIGDASDNIKGVPRCGPAIASKLLKRFDTVEGILEGCRANADLVPRKLAPRILGAEADGTLALAKRLITLDCNVPGMPTLDDLRMKSLDIGPDTKAGKLFKMLRIHVEKFL